METKDATNALSSLFLFIPYTIFPRWAEVAMGVLAWGNLIVIFIGLLKSVGL